jgi:hypothetical protein
MQLTQEIIDGVRLNFDLDSLTALNLKEEGFPRSFKEYVNLYFRFSKGQGRHGLIWELPTHSFEMIIDNNIGRLVGDIWLYALNENFEVEKKTMLLMR